MVLGALSDVGGQAYLAQQAIKNPTAFLKLLSRCLPKDITNSDGSLSAGFRELVARESARRMGVDPGTSTH